MRNLSVSALGHHKNHGTGACDAYEEPYSSQGKVICDQI